MPRRSRHTDTPPATAPATRLASRREQAGLSQADLADLTGVSRSTIQRIERGLTHDPTVRTLNNLALALECELEDLIEPAWRDWKVLDRNRSAPPTSKTLARYRHRRRWSSGPTPGGDRDDE